MAFSLFSSLSSRPLVAMSSSFCLPLALELFVMLLMASSHLSLMSQEHLRGIVGRGLLDSTLCCERGGSEE